MYGELRQQLLEDLITTVQSDLGQEIKISNSNLSLSKIFIGNTNQVYHEIQVSSNQGGYPLPDATGQYSQVTLVLSEILNYFGALPQLGWPVNFIDLPGRSFVIKDVQPDTTQGILILSIGD